MKITSICGILAIKNGHSRFHINVQFGSSLRTFYSIFAGVWLKWVQPLGAQNNGDTKSEACKKYEIDYMIDDDPYNFKRTSSKTKCIIYDDAERFEGNKNILTRWKDIETYIERNR